MNKSPDDVDKPLTLSELMRGAQAVSEPEAQGPRYWRSLSELADDGTFTEEVAQAVAGVRGAIEGLDDASRRRFMKLMGASFALAGVAGCSVQPVETIVPYVEQPESIVPGKAMYFATASALGGDGVGLLVESQMGRPIKIEGNPTHPASQGATDVFSQAEILSLYDPDRSQVIVHDGRVDTWEHFLGFAIDLREKQREGKGKGLRILTRSVSSPTLADQIQRLLKELPEARWHSYEAVTRDTVRQGAKLAFGEPLEPVYNFAKADVVVSLDADFLGSGPGRLSYARAFADRRAQGEVVEKAAAQTMNRLYAIESTPTLTGAMADHRLPLSARDVAHAALAIAQVLKVEGAPAADPRRLESQASWLAALAADLGGRRGKSLVVAGDSQPAEVHALVFAINAALGNVGETVNFFPPTQQGPTDQIGSLVELVRDIEKGAVDTLVILGANPVYETPADLKFAEALKSPKLNVRVHLGLYDDETAALCNWHLPEAHFLESWGDVRAFNGAATIQQPLIAPLYKGKTSNDVLAALLGQGDLPGLEIVRSYWKGRLPAATFEETWRKALQDGVVAEPADAVAKPKPPAAAKLDQVKFAAGAVDGLEIVFRPDPTIWDGRYANNGWLQELPKPMTTLTWENAALVSPALAKRLGLENNQIVSLEFRSTLVEAPVWITPGQADDSVTVHLGYGRATAGRVGTGIGFNAYLLRRSDALWFSDGLKLTPTTRTHTLAITQHHHDMAGRDIVRASTVDAFHEKLEHGHDEAKHASHHGLSLYPDPPVPQSEDYAWAMAIDLNRCIGCGACTIACQAENNIPIVGRDQVLNSREMHWIRVDRYYEGEDSANPSTYFQPVPCMHCEKAPCELVCPVEATTHSDEGINEMTYNRCVGTRYCGNNCPYKVRRFNFLQYSDKTTPSLKLLNNPDVTVRMRGVMEKCTYCVQRINEARINAQIEDRKIGGDEVVTACQGACPTRAIVFGNMKDPESSVAKARKSPRHYALLAELGTLPRTTYLTRLSNPSPADAAEKKAENPVEPRHG
ncbi:MAG: TAT-variant-translocated molybdopterin oxidoreductase [Paludisphaera borealis]|uniref:TAT-variant-translocated molybdopterin oxidoreductase n=1 Tax=Paludisphaera borealis TaxID=1387353 RepID=UPI00284EC34A|nr:TAT-variant-translocated molybdopterin oxidoreductase [Paludisphaera borealis]MDR3622689.1 TAT-variant-translocated molybdopterin oxidoreductase [Paludisphaera borealis]